MFQFIILISPVIIIFLDFIMNLLSIDGLGSSGLNPFQVAETSNKAEIMLFWVLWIFSPSDSDLLSLVGVDAASDVVHLDLGHPIDPAIGDIIDLGLQLSKFCLTCLN